MKYIITESQYRKLQEQRVKGEEISPEKYVTHTSNPINRDSIMELGIKTTLGECYLIYADSNYGEDEECVPAVFATNSIKKKDLFDSTYDDDIWVINTEIANVQWYNDAHFEGGDYKHIVTFEDIPVEAIKLVYKGTGGDSLGNHNNDDELTLTESQVEKMKEYMNNILDKESEYWDVKYFKFQEMRVMDESGDVIFSYTTNYESFGELINILHISPYLLRRVIGFLPLMDEYYIKEWFSKKYKRRVDEVSIFDEED